MLVLYMVLCVSTIRYYVNIMLVIFYQSDMASHLDEYSSYHIHPEAGCCTELKEQANKRTATLEHLCELVTGI